MKELGEILRERRLEKKLTIEQVADQIRVRHNYLEVIEAGDYNRSDIYMIGYIKNYSSFLGVNYRKYLDSDSKGNSKASLSGESSSSGDLQNISTSPSMTTLTISVALIIVTVGVLFFLKNYNYVHSKKIAKPEVSKEILKEEIEEKKEEFSKKKPKSLVINSFQSQISQLDDVDVIITKAKKPTEISIFDDKDDLVARKNLEQDEVFEYELSGQNNIKIFTNSANSIDIEFR